jgi:ATP-dependent Lon protease
MTFTAYREASAIRALILDPSPISGPRESSRPLTLQQLQFGGEFLLWDARADVCALLEPLNRREDLPRECRLAIQAVFTKPCAGTALRAERALLAACEKKGSPEHLATPLYDAAQLLPYHAAAFGSAEAAARISARSLDTAWLHLRGNDLGRGWLALRAALLWASDAQEDLRDVKYTPRPNFDRLTAFDLQALSFARAFAVIAKAERMISDEDAILRGGAGAQGGGAPEVDDLPGLEELPSLGEYLAAASEPAPQPPPAPRPALSRVVIPSLKHLPQPSKYAVDRQDTPRALGEPFSEKALPLAPAPDPAAFAARLNAEFPWAREVNEAYANALVGAPFAALPPRILVGGAGGGKTSWARAAFEAAGLPSTLYSGAGVADGGTFSGTSRQWSTWRLGVSLQALLRAQAASGGIIIDEVEKGTHDRRHGRLDETLLAFLERASTARRIFDPALECEVDLSGVSYILTANDLSGLCRPLLDRAPPIAWPMPRAEDLPLVAGRILAEIRRERGLAEAWCPGLDGEELDLLSDRWRGGSLRPLRRLVEAVVAGREAFARSMPN